ncbi:SOS response-associated peptidase [Catelliglobosispora koreensis]|uniref:SOS response-associated peptidase n=1 Tax=Catelliglobosispora koreensis TaxID=129052 RepID=UPI00037AA942|nr:SOS response-associated peptidase [Catelliglobosispora koreensis]
MCGRYASTKTKLQLAETFHVSADYAADGVREDYNVAPTKTAPAILSTLAKDDPAAQMVRRLEMLRWGLIPPWAKDLKIGAKMVNARAETISDKPSYRRPFAARRCLIPLDGFYEWVEEDQGGPKPVKQPYFLRPKDGGILAAAGVWERWHDPDKPKDDPDAWLHSFVIIIITTDATDDVGRVHDRMPMIVLPEQWDEWLDPRLLDPNAARILMGPPEPGTLDIYAVSRAVNHARSNGPELIRPLD